MLASRRTEIPSGRPHLSTDGCPARTPAGRTRGGTGWRGPPSARTPAELHDQGRGVLPAPLGLASRTPRVVAGSSTDRRRIRPPPSRRRSARHALPTDSATRTWVSTSPIAPLRGRSRPKGLIRPAARPASTHRGMLPGRSGGWACAAATPASVCCPAPPNTSPPASSLDQETSADGRDRGGAQAVMPPKMADSRTAP